MVKIHRFLDVHVILLLGDRQRALLCSMSGGDDDRVAVHPVFY
jgi:hypothetical protein